MIKKHMLLTAFLGLLSLGSFAQKKNYQVTAVAFYNFENFFDADDDAKNKGDDDFLPTGPYHYTEEVFREKAHNIATVLQKLGTDVTPDGPALIGTAEIENDHVLQVLVSQPEIKNRNYQFVHFESPDFRGIDVALLYNPKYFKVLAAEALKTDISAFGEKGGRTRDVLHVTGILSGDTVHVFVNHWPSRRGGEAASAPLRAIAAGVSKKVIDSLMAVNPATRVIDMGDLNDDPTNASISKVLGATGDKSKVGQTGIYNPWVAFYKQGLGTLAYNSAWDLFDQIMVSGEWLKKPDDHWRYYKAEVFSREFLKNSSGPDKGAPHRSFDINNNWINGYSDHFPTIIYFIKEAQ
ncbi:endonuclease/exonuclease/phosphatase family protein [Chitinophagaceae bacterium MMS25-I14]